MRIENIIKQNSLAGEVKLDYNVDLVYCIDATISMRPVLDTVVNNALNFYDDFLREMDKKNKPIANVRIKVVAFRDYVADGDMAMLETDFFDMPSQINELKNCLSSIVASGGGDDPEDGLEALAYAIKSDWCQNAGRRRHVIVVWSDAGTHKLGYGKKVSSYPDGMAKDFSELTEWWGNSSKHGIMEESAKRLLMFTPDEPGWSDVRDNWNNVIHYNSRAGRGLEEVDYVQILNAICNSI